MNCLDCGYDLRELGDRRCPECGRAFEADDRKTWCSAKAFRKRKQAILAGAVAALLPAALGLYIVTQMALGYGGWLMMVIYAMLGVIPVLFAVGLWLRLLSAGECRPSRRATITLWGLAVFYLSLLTQWPTHLTFLVHRPALNHHAQQLLAGTTTQGPSHIGIYTIHQTSTRQHQPGTASVTFTIATGTGPDYLVFGMTDQQIEASFNIWSYTRLDPDWHIVHGD